MCLTLRSRCSRKTTWRWNVIHWIPETTITGSSKPAFWLPGPRGEGTTRPKKWTRSRVVMKTTWWIEKIQKVCLIENKTSTTISSCGHTFGPLAFSTPWGLVRLSERRIPLWQVLSGLDPQFDCIEHLPAQGWRQTGHGYWYGTVRWFEMRGWTCTPLMAIHLLSRRKMFEMEFEYFKLGVIDSTPGTPPVAGHY